MAGESALVGTSSTRKLIGRVDVNDDVARRLSMVACPVLACMTRRDCNLN